MVKMIFFLKEKPARGQGLVEYALILVLVAVVAIAALMLLGGDTASLFDNLRSNLQGEGEESEQSIPYLINDFSTRILDFYAANGRWPKSWGDERFTELGLDPKDWEEPVSDVLWIPHGDNIGIGNVSGDNIRLYVDKLDGSRMEIYTVVWCYPTSDRCYYRSPLPENEVDISTLEVVHTD